MLESSGGSIKWCETHVEAALLLLRVNPVGLDAAALRAAGAAQEAASATQPSSPALLTAPQGEGSAAAGGGGSRGSAAQTALPSAPHLQRSKSEHGSGPGVAVPSSATPLALSSTSLGPALSSLLSRPSPALAAAAGSPGLAMVTEVANFTVGALGTVRVPAGDAAAGGSTGSTSSTGAVTPLALATSQAALAHALLSRADAQLARRAASLALGAEALRGLCSPSATHALLFQLERALAEGSSHAIYRTRPAYLSARQGVLEACARFVAVPVSAVEAAAMGGGSAAGAGAGAGTGAGAGVGAGAGAGDDAAAPLAALPPTLSSSRRMTQLLALRLWTLPLLPSDFAFLGSSCVFECLRAVSGEVEKEDGSAACSQQAGYVVEHALSARFAGYDTVSTHF